MQRQEMISREQRAERMGEGERERRHRRGVLLVVDGMRRYVDGEVGYREMVSQSTTEDDQTVGRTNDMGSVPSTLLVPTLIEHGVIICVSAAWVDSEVVKVFKGTERQGGSLQFVSIILRVGRKGGMDELMLLVFIHLGF